MQVTAKKNTLILLIFTVLFHNSAIAEDSCNQSASIIQKSKYRAEAGFTPVDNSITEIYAETACKSVDAYVWAVQNNKTSKFNEVDIGVGYTYSPNDFTYRVMYERWEYPEGTGNNDVVIGLLAYSGWAIKTRLKWTYVTEDSGQLLSAVFLKPFVLNKSESNPLKLIAGLRINCVDDYFGATDCPSNIVYSAKFMANYKRFSYGLIVDFHDGQGRFDDTTNLGLQVGLSF